MKKYQLREEVDLLRKYIRESILLLKEDADVGYGDYLGDLYGGGGGGGGGGDGGPVFITAFTDVFKTASAEAQKMIERVKSFTNVSFQAVMSGINPFYKAEYSKIFQNEAQKISAIQSKYNDVYQRTYKAFEDNDFAWAAAICSPEAFLTAKFAKQVPDVAANLAGFVPGGNKIVTALNSSLNRIGRILSENEKQQDKKPNPLDVQDEVRNSVKEFLTSVLEATNDWKKVSSMNLKQFEAFLSQKEGVDPSSVEKIKKELNTQKQNWQAKISQEKDGGKEASQVAKKIDDDEWAREFLKTVPDAIVKEVKKMLQKRMEKAKSGGAPDDCSWIKWHQEILSRI